MLYNLILSCIYVFYLFLFIYVFVHCTIEEKPVHVLPKKLL